MRGIFLKLVFSSRLVQDNIHKGSLERSYIETKQVADDIINYNN